MTRIGYEFTKGSEYYYDLMLGGEEIPILVKQNEESKLKIDNIYKTLACRYPNNKEILLIKDEDLEYYENLEKRYVASLGNDVSEEECKEMLKSYKIYQQYQDLPWEEVAVLEVK